MIAKTAFQVGLVEARERTAGVGRLEMGRCDDLDGPLGGARRGEHRSVEPAELVVQDPGEPDLAPGSTRRAGGSQRE